MTIDEKVTIAVQINGKVRDDFEIDINLAEDEVKKMALEREKVQKYLAGQTTKKVIYVYGKLISIVI
jgi:leucyl-tRNA synthetase